MAYLVGKTEVDVINKDAVDIRDNLPIGFYKLRCADMRGFYFEKTEYSTSHGKIYGHSQKIADHVISAFEHSNNNLGVLFSGGKGLGKTLTTRLIIEKLKDKYPLIVIDSYSPGMFDFLSTVSNAIYIFDEFEKTFKGNVKNTEESGVTRKQEQMLSFIDGTASGSHNLFLLTANQARDIDDNLLNRPGRIRYHYKYDNCDRETIHNYCVDNLKKMELEEELIDALINLRYVSLDIVQAIVSELNQFDVTVEEALNYLNIEVERFHTNIVIKYGDAKKNIKTAVARNSQMFYPGCEELHFYVELSDYISDTNNNDDEDMDWAGINILIDTKNLRIPRFSPIDVTDRVRITYENDVHVPVYSVELSDEDGVASASAIRCTKMPTV